jgi:hypothetical protein
MKQKWESSGGLYKERTIISGIGDALWSKTNFGPTGNNHPEPYIFKTLY